MAKKGIAHRMFAMAYTPLYARRKAKRLTLKVGFMEMSNPAGQHLVDVDSTTHV